MKGRKINEYFGARLKKHKQLDEVVELSKITIHNSNRPTEYSVPFNWLKTMLKHGVRSLSRNQYNRQTNLTTTSPCYLLILSCKTYTGSTYLKFSGGRCTLWRLYHSSWIVSLILIWSSWLCCSGMLITYQTGQTLQEVYEDNKKETKD